MSLRVSRLLCGAPLLMSCLLASSLIAQQRQTGPPAVRAPTLQEIKARDYSEDVSQLRRLSTTEVLARATAVVTLSGAGEELAQTATEGEPIEVREDKDGPALLRFERTGKPRLWVKARGEVVKCERQGKISEFKGVASWFVVLVVGDRSASLICLVRPEEEAAAAG